MARICATVLHAADLQLDDGPGDRRCGRSTALAAEAHQFGLEFVDAVDELCDDRDRRVAQSEPGTEPTDAADLRHLAAVEPEPSLVVAGRLQQPERHQTFDKLWMEVTHAGEHLELDALGRLDVGCHQPLLGSKSLSSASFS